MDEINLCGNCEHVKILCKIVGRCLAWKGAGMLFCKLKEPSHVCKKHKRIEE